MKIDKSGCDIHTVSCAQFNSLTKNYKMVNINWEVWLLNQYDQVVESTRV